VPGLLYADRVQETCSSPGTGTASLLGAVTGYQAFGTACVTGQIVYYTLTDGTNWEVGRGTYTTSSDTLSRDVVLSSSNSGALVNFTAATVNVWLDQPAGTIADQALTTAIAACIVYQ
jgi:hypothetical protein